MFRVRVLCRPSIHFSKNASFENGFCEERSDEAIWFNCETSLPTPSIWPPNFPPPTLVHFRHSLKSEVRCLMYDVWYFWFPNFDFFLLTFTHLGTPLLQHSTPPTLQHSTPLLPTLGALVQFRHSKLPKCYESVKECNESVSIPPPPASNFVSDNPVNQFNPENY